MPPGAPQIATSITNQRKTTGQAIREFELVDVDEEHLEGVTGSIPGNGSDIDRIIARKRSLNEFKLLVVQDARFTAYLLVQGYRDAGTDHPQLVVQRRATIRIDRSMIAPRLTDTWGPGSPASPGQVITPGPSQQRPDQRSS